MPRTARPLLAGGHYHLINRRNNRAAVFAEAGDYSEFFRLICRAQTRLPLRILAVCLMPNHFHFVVAQDAHLLTVMRYVERNALRAGLVKRAEAWPWGSLHWRLRRPTATIISPPPITLPPDWSTFVNEPQTPDELVAIRTCVNGQRPFGNTDWVMQTDTRSGLRESGGHEVRPARSRSISAK